MRLIDADALLKTPFRITGTFDNKYPFEAITVKMIESYPAIDAVSVVRCRDCEHYLSKTKFCLNISGIRCDVEPDWYCSNGQRLEDKSDE